MILCSLYNIISGVRVFASSAVDRRLESRSSKAKDYKIGIYCHSAKHVA